jgi:hypothetical protein
LCSFIIILRLGGSFSTPGMRMEDPVPTFSHIVTELRNRHPDLAYVHVVEPVVSGNAEQPVSDDISNDFLRKIWAPRPFISAGAFTPESAPVHADKTGDLVAFGRYYISNVSDLCKLDNLCKLTTFSYSLIFLSVFVKVFRSHPTIVTLSIFLSQRKDTPIIRLPTTPVLEKIDDLHIDCNSYLINL